MVAFYNQGDQEIYDEGEHFIPQEYYRLNKFNNTVAPVPPEITQQTTQNFGIPYTDAFTGGGPGTGFGRWGDLDKSSMKVFDKQVWGTTKPGGQKGWTNQPVTGYLNVNSGLYQTEEGKNVNHLGLEIPSFIGTIANAITGQKFGEKQVGDTAGTFTKDKVDEDQAIFDRIVRRQKINAMRKDDIYSKTIDRHAPTTTDQSGKGDGGSYTPPADPGTTGSWTPGGTYTAPAKQRDYSTHKAYGLKEGGRIGFFKGALADTAEGKAMSPGTSASGGTRHGSGGTNDGIKKKLHFSPIIDTKSTDLGFNYPTGVVGFDTSTPLGRLRATLNLKNYVEGEDVDPQIDYTKNIGNFNFKGTTDLDNYHLGATYNKGPFFAGATTNNMGDTNFNVGARWQWGGKDGGIVGLL